MSTRPSRILASIAGDYSASRSSTAWSKLSFSPYFLALSCHEENPLWCGAAMGQQVPENPSADRSELEARSPRVRSRVTSVDSNPHREPDREPQPGMLPPHVRRR